MSGGVLTDCCHDLFRLDEWAEMVRRENPLLARQMMDLGKLLHVYDDYMSGDASEKRLEEAWTQYRVKWIGVSTEDLKDRIMAAVRSEAMSYIDRIDKGYDGRPPWWEVD